MYKEEDPNLIRFPTDRVLHTDEGFKPFFLKSAESQAAFFEDYRESHRRLSELGARFEPAEGVVIDEN